MPTRLALLGVMVCATLAAAGCATVAELTMRTGAGATCGSCLEMAADILQAAQPAPRESLLPILTLSNAA